MPVHDSELRTSVHCKQSDINPINVSRNITDKYLKRKSLNYVITVKLTKALIDYLCKDIGSIYTEQKICT